MKNGSLINRKAMKKFILEQCEKRGRRFTSVSKEALDKYNMLLMKHVIHDVKSHPSIGKRFREVWV